MKDPRDVVRRAMITEKGVRMREQANQYIFEVHPEANKIEIRRAIEEIFSVRVEDVRTLNNRGKPKRLGRFAGRRAAWKKAIITLEKGQTIELFEQI
jgi:large subunit ribosomal protein L23